MNKLRDGTDKCPDCGSPDLEIGSFPLRCFSCGWNYLNVNPCRVCGGKSVSVVGANGTYLYGCVNHPISEDEWKTAFSSFYSALRF